MPLGSAVPTKTPTALFANICPRVLTRPRKKPGFFTPEEIYLANLSHYTSESNVALQS
jgi:hypothetical protein